MAQVEVAAQRVESDSLASTTAGGARILPGAESAGSGRGPGNRVVGVQHDVAERNEQSGLGDGAGDGVRAIVAHPPSTPTIRPSPTITGNRMTTSPSSLPSARASDAGA